MARQKRFDKHEVLKDATTLFWEKGFYQTSIQDLVDTLGINRASLYDTYEDKEGLFIHCLQLYRDNTILAAKTMINTEDSIKQGFKCFFKWLVEEVYKDKNKKGCFICNTYAELLPSENNEIYSLLKQTKDLWIQTISQALKKGLNNNEIKKGVDVQQVTYAIYTSMLGVTILSKINKNSTELQNSLDLHLEIFN